LEWADKHGYSFDSFFKPDLEAQLSVGFSDRRSLQWAMANRLEQFFHGSASGIDTGLSIYEGINAIFPQAKSNPLVQSIPARRLNLVIGAIPRVSNTKALVTKLQKKMLASDAQVMSSIKKLGEISTTAIELFSNNANQNDFMESLKNLISKAQKHLKKLDLSTKAVNTCFKLAKDQGAYACKLSGAGGGGAFFCLIPNELDGDNFIKQLSLDLEKEEIELSVPLFKLQIS
jgi:mevalonate kinase